MVLLAFAVAGLVASVIAHVSTFLGVDPQEVFPPVWLLHFGIFAVGIPLAILQKRDNVGRSFTALFSPKWMRTGLQVLFVYTVFNFFSNMQSGQARSGSHGYQIVSHGRVVQQLDEAGYHRARAREVRVFSGHWMLFYGAMAMILFEQRRRPAAAASTEQESAQS
jgi:hypothetical protein